MEVFHFTRFHGVELSFDVSPFLIHKSPSNKKPHLTFWPDED
jgi:hypothetical protein